MADAASGRQCEGTRRGRGTRTKGTESLSAPKLVPVCRRLTAYRPRKWCGVGLSVSTVAPGRFQDISECPRRDRLRVASPSGALSRGNLRVTVSRMQSGVYTFHYIRPVNTCVNLAAGPKWESNASAATDPASRRPAAFRRRGAGNAGLILVGLLALRWGCRRGRLSLEN